MVEGRGFVVHPTYDAAVEDYLRPLFQQYYTMSFDNYPVEMERLHGARIAECKAQT
jgi:formylmethanofuran dehydrogenase subunit A